MLLLLVPGVGMGASEITPPDDGPRTRPARHRSRPNYPYDPETP